VKGKKRDAPFLPFPSVDCVKGKGKKSDVPHGKEWEEGWKTFLLKKGEKDLPTGEKGGKCRKNLRAEGGGGGKK